MKEELKAKLRAVFLEESSSDLASISSQMTDLRGLLPCPDTDKMEQFYGSVHKLKGACRAVKIPVAERLGHQVEYLFRALAERPSEISAQMFSDVEAGVRHMVEHIEAFGKGGSCPLDVDKVEALNWHLQAVGSEESVDLAELKALAPAAEPAPKQVDPRLIASFSAEAHDLLRVAREELALIGSERDLAKSKFHVEQLLRAAHTLKGGARVVRMDSVGRIAHELGARLAGLADVETVADILASTSVVGGVIDSIEDAFVDHSAISATGEAEPVSASATAESGKAVEFHRVDSVRMSELFENYAELLILCPELRNLRSEFTETKDTAMSLLKQERELRYQIGPSLHQPGLGKVASYVNFLSRQLKLLSQKIVVQEKSLRRIDDGLNYKIGSLDRSMSRVQEIRVDEVLSGLSSMVREVCKELGKDVEFTVKGYELEADRDVLQKLRGPLIHLLRNAVDHGIESVAEREGLGKPRRAQLSLCFEIVSDQFKMVLSDDGRGFQTERLKAKAIECGLFSAAEAARLTEEQVYEIAFSPHLTTSSEVSNVSGRGIGLSSAAEVVRALNGLIEVSSEAGVGTRLTVSIPVSHASSNIVMVLCGESVFGIHSKKVKHVFRLQRDELLEIDGKLHCEHQGAMMPFDLLESHLGLARSAAPVEGLQSVLVIGTGRGDVAYGVDSVMGEQKMVLRELPTYAAKNPLFSNAFLLNGGVCALVVDLETARHSGRMSLSDMNAEVEPTALSNGSSRVPRILVVDDSYTARTLEVGVLEANGFTVFDAIDGVDALRMLRNEEVDLVVSDIQMPRMDGFELLKEIKANPAWSGLPVILVSSLADDKIVRKGLSLGADSYIVKKDFEHQELIETIQQFL